MTTDLILGTAGHIDHGKTSLIRALTGRDTDRLPEEKRRGITIELGFAELLLGEYRLGIVDVPGHEKFVRNMLAGATGMDLALLVVAADDSVKPQTREHLEILRLLDLQAGVIAITKCDLVDPDWTELVQEEVRELVEGTFLEKAPMIPTSATSGVGLDALREALAEAAAQAAARTGREAPFRMAIDRTFTIAGHGTVVTGSVSSGACRLGDELMIEPGEVRVRVRGLQNHDRQVEAVHRGQRAAINLAGIHHDETRRGQELCSVGHLVPSRLLTVDLALLGAAPRPLKDRARVRLHVGTAELLAAVRLLAGGAIEPGQRGAAQVYLNEAAATVWNQPFVIRSESPVVTIGGGRILHPNAEPLRRPDAEQVAMVEQLTAAEPVARASAALYFAGLRDWDPGELPRTAGVWDVDDAYEALRERGDLLEIPVSPTRTRRLHRRTFQHLCRRVEAVLNRLHDQFPLRSVLDRSLLINAFRYLPDEALLQQALKALQADGRIHFRGSGIGLVDRGPKLSQNEQKLLNRLVDDFLQAGLETPTVKQYTQQVTKNQDSVPQLVSLAAANGDLVEIQGEYFVHRDVEQQTRQRLLETLEGSQGLTVSEIREILNTTRKYAVPLCEYFDRVGFTRREGDRRVLAGP